MSQDAATDQNAIRSRAYEYWQQRGCPAGTSEQDWLAAECAVMSETTSRHDDAGLTPSLPLAAPRAEPAVLTRRSRRSRSILTQTASGPAARLLVALVPNARRAC